MSTYIELLFDVTFYVAAPFWALMIFAPGWSVTRRIIGSPLIVLPPLVVFVLVMGPDLGAFLAAVSRPTLDGVQALVSSPEGTAAIWAQVIAWDLFIGRWMYLDSRERRIHPLVMAPVLLVTILISPLGLPAYFALRLPLTRRRDQAAADTAGRTTAVAG
ncbi:MAG: DUF4281 domain-containing protein [Streptosporangiales bacterium]|nr:DUF4281 domain-containing protein [Streptosporangiales bacterium]